MEWCPTEDMIGDFMTKPNQGALFTKFRDMIMGVISPQEPGMGKAQMKRLADGKASTENSNCTVGKSILQTSLNAGKGKTHRNMGNEDSLVLQRLGITEVCWAKTVKGGAVCHGKD